MSALKEGLKTRTMTPIKLVPSIHKGKKVAMRDKFVLHGGIWEIVNIKNSRRQIVCRLVGEVGPVQTKTKKKPGLVWTPEGSKT